MKGPAYSGKFVLRIPTNLHRALSERAARQGISLNQLCMELLGRPTREALSSLWLEKIRETYERQGLEGVVLFGSQARGRARASSDTDLLLVFREGTSIRRSLYREWDDGPGSAAGLEKVSIHCVSLPDEGETPGSLWLEVALEGRIEWEKAGRVSDYLAKVRRRISEGMFVRDSSHGHGFWKKIG